MGLFDGLFGKRQELPPLDPSSVAAQRLDQRREEVESFVESVKDKLEIIPSDDAVYVFIGKPPGSFGVAWLQDGKLHNLKTLMQEKGLSPQGAQALSDRLRRTYEQHGGEERFSANVAGKTVTVTPSESFARDVVDVIREV